MRWNTYHQAAKQLETKLQDVAAEHNRLFVELRDIDSAIETKRAEHKTQQQQLNKAQGDYYTVGAEVSGLEQAIKHHEASHEETLLEIKRTRLQAEQSLSQLETDLQALEAIKEALLEAEESSLIAQEKQEEDPAASAGYPAATKFLQAEWEAYRTVNSRYKEQAEVHRVKAIQLENQCRQLQTRMDKLHSERDELSSSQLQTDIETLDADIEIIGFQRDSHQAQLEQLHHQIREQRQQVKQFHDSLHTRRSESHSIKGKITSLELLQQHAMGKG